MYRIDICNIDDNYLAELLWAKPKGFFKEKLYFRNKIKPLLKRFKEPITFSDMCAFSDFIKIIEIVFFYHNDPRYIEDIDGEVKIISDNKLDDDKNKHIGLILNKEKVQISFKMSLQTDDAKGVTNEIIMIECKNEFGKKVTTKFNIINAQFDNEISKNSYNLLYNINHILSKSLSDLFYKYYKLA